jgi:hypothetical protein
LIIPKHLLYLQPQTKRRGLADSVQPGIAEAFKNILRGGAVGSSLGS